VNSCWPFPKNFQKLAYFREGKKFRRMGLGLRKVFRKEPRIELILGWRKKVQEKTRFPGTFKG